MSQEFRFYLSNEDMERLFAIKEDMGKDNLTGNEFARMLLEKELHRLHPQKVCYDDDTGERIKEKTS